MGIAQESESYSAEDLEKGKDASGSGVLRGMKRRSSVTLKAIARTFSVPGGRNIVRIPSLSHPLSFTLEENEENDASTSAAENSNCFSNKLSDAELMESEVVVEGMSRHSVGIVTVCVLNPPKEDSGTLSTC